MTTKDRIPRFTIPSIEEIHSSIPKITMEVATRVHAVLSGTADINEIVGQRIDLLFHRGHEMKLIASDLLLDGFGVEELIPENCNETYSDGGIDFCPPFSYVNLGDTYAATLVRDHAEGKWMIASWGDVIEEWEKEHPKLQSGELERMFHAYVECALWSSTDESDDSGGNPLDDNYDESDIVQETLEEMEEDCRNFAEGNLVEIHRCLSAGFSWEQIGHDFWLTRNGHGAGFWDRNYPDGLGDTLTAASKPYGSYDLCVGDDGEIYGQ